MNKKLFRKLTLLTAAVVTVGATFAFAGCDTANPEVTITYTFQNKDYEVDYILSRSSAPQTVQHFIELAEHGYYEGLCIHDYKSDALYTGGYTYDEGSESLVMKDYFTTVQDWNLTQSVYRTDDLTTGTNTLYGEFEKNGVKREGSYYTHSRGALVMFYNDTNESTERVYTKRSGDSTLQSGSYYSNNCATSLFYTFTGSSSAKGDSECVFGKAKDYDNQLSGDNGLLTAIDDYIETLSEEADGFTKEFAVANINQYDPIVKSTVISATFEVPIEAIVIKSVKVTKY